MDIRIDTSSIFHSFGMHFNSNERILFSGNFGTGKTTFLTEYFEKRKDCNVFKLYPVTYASSPNEDIFELIKYDLLLTLIEDYEDYIELVNEDYSNILSFQFAFLFQAQWSPLLFKLIQLADNTGKSAALEKFLQEGKKQYEDFKAKHKDEQSDIDTFMLHLYSRSGSPRENDLISQLIRTLLVRVKQNTKNSENGAEENTIEKQNVLIIDDLDRLDPEHIFRLLNVFSVNFGKEAIHNKFGFDRIIIVCDIKNIREIYAHKYGRLTDFEGYIDKFYSSAPFDFNTNEFLHGYLKDFLFKYKLQHDNLQFSDEHNVTYNPIYVILKAIFNALLVTKKLNLRSLLNNQDFDFQEKLINVGYKQLIHDCRYPIYIVLYILRKIYDSDAYLKEVLADLEDFDKSRFRREINVVNIYHDDAYNMLVDSCLPFLLDPKEIDTLAKDLRNSSDIQNFKQYLPMLQVSVEGKLSESRNYEFRGSFYEFQFDKFYNESIPEQEIFVNPFPILLETYKKILSITHF